MTRTLGVPPFRLISLRKNIFAARTSRFFCTKISITSPSWSTALDIAQVREEQAHYVYERSCNIRIPNNPNGTKVVRYTCNMYGVANDFSVTRASDNLNNSALTDHTIDLSFPHLTGPVDVRAIRPFIRSLKFYLFGGEKARLTRRRCERFFEDDDNFDLNNTRNKHSGKKVKRKPKRKRRRIRVEA